jgi:hypothetical protein
MAGVLQGATVSCTKELASHEGLYAADPMVKICALPIDGDIDEVLAGISADVSRDTGIEEQYITYYWVPMTNVICMGEKTTDYPILVDLYVPGFFTNELIASMMTCLAAAIEEHVGIDREWVFIQAHFPNQGQVYLSGEVQVWDDYKGQENAAEYSIE